MSIKHGSIYANIPCIHQSLKILLYPPKEILDHQLQLLLFLSSFSSSSFSYSQPYLLNTQNNLIRFDKKIENHFTTYLLIEISINNRNHKLPTEFIVRYMIQIIIYQTNPINKFK